MAMFEDNIGGANTICEDNGNVDISLNSHLLNADSEVMPLLQNIATSKPVEKNVLHVYDVSLPFDTARKTIDILPKEAVVEYNRLIQQRDRLPAPKRDISGLALTR